MRTDPLSTTADDGIATVWLDAPGPNALDAVRVGDIAAAVERAARAPSIEVVVLRSARPGGFGVGVDPHRLAELTTDADRRTFAAAGQRALAAIAACPAPTVAVIEGACLDAAFELALACDYRFAVATPATTLGFPGITDARLPCWGGLTRLLAVVPPEVAVVVASGVPVSAREAAEAGLVDDVCSSRRAKVELRTFLDRLQLAPRKRRPRRGWFDTWRLRSVVRDPRPAWVREHHPARVAALDVLAATNFDARLAAERRAFAAVAASRPAAAGLALAVTTPRVPTGANPVPAFPSTVAVVGDTAVSLVLAGELAARGAAVRIASSRPADELRAAALAGPVARRRVTPLERDQAAGRIAAIPPTAELDAPLVVVADGNVAEVESRVGRRAIVAACGPFRPAMLDRPGRALRIGLPLTDDAVYELGRTPDTAADAVAAVAAWVRAVGGRPVVVTNAAELPARRVLAAYWDEAVRLVAEGVPIADIDAAAVAAGLGRGPLEAIDRFGLAAACELVPRLRPLVDAGEGFYHHPPDDPPGPNVVAQVALMGDADPPADDSPPIDRLRLRAVNAAAACLAGERFADAADLDLVVAVGAGLFRPHGGPLRFADAAGVGGVVARLGELADALGRRFRPHPELARRAAGGERFYDRAAAGRRVAA